MHFVLLGNSYSTSSADDITQFTVSKWDTSSGFYSRPPCLWQDITLHNGLLVLVDYVMQCPKAAPQLHVWQWWSKLGLSVLLKGMWLLYRARLLSINNGTISQTIRPSHHLQRLARERKKHSLKSQNPLLCSESHHMFEVASRHTHSNHKLTPHTTHDIPHAEKW